MRHIMRGMMSHPTAIARMPAQTPAGEARAHHALSLPLLPGAQDAPLAPPDWIMLIPAGVFSGRDGRGPYTLDAAAVLAAFEQGGIDLPIDYDHQTLTSDAKAGPVPAAGWIKALELRDGSLWGRVEWTPAAASLIVNKEYRYLSPVFRHDKAGRVLALEGAGLTHYPNLDLQPVAHRAAPDDGDTAMTDLKPLAEALGAAPDADAQTLVAHARALREQATKAPDPREWVPMSQHQKVAQELAALQKQVAKEKADAAVRAAMSAGKLAPAMQTWALAYAEKAPDGFAQWVAAAPAILPAEDKTAAHRAAPAPDGLTDEDRYVCSALGIPEADFAAHKKGMSHG
ncbi:MAG: phage protease [Rhodocyclaceae bacterium]|nr:phage protease [Rhodocyclaceae bacterium]